MSNNIDKLTITNENLDEILGSTGYLFPNNEKELLQFEKVYDDYVFKLSNHRIDFESIINESFVCQVYESKIITLIDDQEIIPLRMVARNGESEIPDEILKKMLSKHSKKEDDKE